MMKLSGPRRPRNGGKCSAPAGGGGVVTVVASGRRHCGCRGEAPAGPKTATSFSTKEPARGCGATSTPCDDPVALESYSDRQDMLLLKCRRMVPLGHSAARQGRPWPKSAPGGILSRASA